MHPSINMTSFDGMQATLCWGLQHCCAAGSCGKAAKWDSRACRHMSQRACKQAKACRAATTFAFGAWGLNLVCELLWLQRL